MSLELSCKTPDGEKQIAVRFHGGFDRGMGVQICIKIVDLLDLLDLPAYIEGVQELNMTINRHMTVRDVLKLWLKDGFEEQSYNLDQKSFLRSRAIVDVKGAFDRFLRVIT